MSDAVHISDYPQHSHSSNDRVRLDYPKYRRRNLLGAAGGEIWTSGSNQNAGRLTRAFGEPEEVRFKRMMAQHSRCCEKPWVARQIAAIDDPEYPGGRRMSASSQCDLPSTAPRLRCPLFESARVISYCQVFRWTLRELSGADYRE